MVCCFPSVWTAPQGPFEAVLVSITAHRRKRARSSWGAPCADPAQGHEEALGPRLHDHITDVGVVTSRLDQLLPTTPRRRRRPPLESNAGRRRDQPRDSRLSHSLHSSALYYIGWCPAASSCGISPPSMTCDRVILVCPGPRCPARLPVVAVSAPEKAHQQSRSTVRPKKLRLRACVSVGGRSRSRTVVAF